MATTTNFGWDTPDDTDLVKDGAAAIRTLGNSIDTSFVDLKGGTTNQVLAKNSNTDLDYKWVAIDDTDAIQNSIVDAKGDLISATAADTPARLAVGTNGDVLTADSTTSTGLKWAALPASGKVLQVVTATTNSGVTESSGSFVDSGLTASITPSATGSKVLVLITQALKWNVAGSAPGIYWQLLRGATVLSDSNILNIYTSDLYNSADLRMPLSYVWLDSPSTTSSTTYKTQIKRYAGSVTAQHSSAYSSIVLMEIGA